LAPLQALDGGSQTSWRPIDPFTGSLPTWPSPSGWPRLIHEQAEELTIAIMDGMASRRLIEEVRGTAQLWTGPERPVSLPHDARRPRPWCSPEVCSAPTATIMRRGRPLLYRLSPHLLQLLRTETLEEARRRMGWKWLVAAFTPACGAAG
jgi:hypothetical protein